jgi:hypothetical protein
MDFLTLQNEDGGSIAGLRHTGNKDISNSLCGQCEGGAERDRAGSGSTMTPAIAQEPHLSLTFAVAVAETLFKIPRLI